MVLKFGILLNKKMQEYLLNKVLMHELKACGGSDNHYISEKGNCFGIGCITVPNINETNWILDSINKKVK